MVLTGLGTSGKLGASVLEILTPFLPVWEGAEISCSERGPLFWWFWDLGFASFWSGFGRLFAGLGTFWQSGAQFLVISSLFFSLLRELDFTFQKALKKRTHLRAKSSKSTKNLVFSWFFMVFHGFSWFFIDF